MAKAKKKLVIGTIDRIDLPFFELYELPCKIDTGADTSAIHCHYVKLIERDGVEEVCFRLLDPLHQAYNGKEFRTSEFKEKKVRSSSGFATYRYTIKTKVKLFRKTYPIYFTLADREQMRYPILLGRRFLKNRFTVDVAQRDLSYLGLRTDFS
jgi:hypothetical protein